MSRSIVFWNVERLFSAATSALRTELADGAPGELARADTTAKINNLRSVLGAIHSDTPIAMVGVCEVETATLVRRLGQTLPQRLTSVDDVATDASGSALDGLNIGLLIDRTYFDGPVTVKTHVIDRTFDTRDILECSLTSSSLPEPVTVYINHWASRLATEGEEKRVTAAHYLRALLREQLRYSTAEMHTGPRQTLRVPPLADLVQRADRPVIVMGDLNDEPFNPSLQILDTTPDETSVTDDLKVRGRSRIDRFRSYKAAPLRLFNPYWQYATASSGSYYRSPRWRIYDQILLSRGLLGSRPQALSYVADSARVFADRAVVGPGGRRVELTKRTGKPKSFSRESQQGCSDHFPVILSLG